MVVVGGGAAGLSAMKTLISNGVNNVVLLEAQDYVGGRVRTHREGKLNNKVLEFRTFAVISR